jgi:hypothetical protein
MARNAALQCHGLVSFYHLDGQNVFGRTMPIRWSESPEPVPLQLQIGEYRGVVIDPQRLTTDSRVDIYPGESCRLGVAARFDDEPECYGWSNLNYFSNPLWRHQDWKLATGRFLIKVTVVSAGEKCTGIFRIVNDVSRKDYRIEPAMSKDKVYGDV